MSVDDIRNKAYGTLEDDLESTLVGPMGPIYEKKDELIEDNDMFEELEQEVITVPTDSEIDDFINEEEPVKMEEEIKEENFVEEELNTYNSEEFEAEEMTNYSELEPVESEIEDYQEVEDDVELYENDMNNEEEFVNNDISDETIEEKFEDEEDSLNDSELFDLIDSMYSELIEK